MKLNEIINLLKQDGKGTKRKVLEMLENASIDDLKELRQSITIKIIRKTRAERKMKE